MDLRVEEFQRHLEAIREEKTVEAYMTSVKAHFIPWMEGQDESRWCSPNLLQEFTDHLCGKLSAASVQLYYIGARTYLSFLRKRGESIAEQEDIDLPRINQKASKIIKSEDLREFMEGARQKPEPYRTCLMLLPLTGMRISEAVSLELSDVVVAKGGYTFLVRDTKGKRDRYVPLLKSGTVMFTDYLRRVRPTLPGDKWIFPSPKARKNTDTPHIHPRVMQDHMKDVRDGRGLDFTLHTLRHVYATVLDREGVSDIVKAKLLGHKSVNTTKGYVHVDPDRFHSDIAAVETPWADTPRQVQHKEGDEE